MNYFMHYKDVELTPAPIESSWILEGEPAARNFLVSSSKDRTTFTYVWDCSAGRFNWFYGVDETLYIVEGGASIILPSKEVKKLEPGVIAFFPKGTQAEWQVQSYIRKVAICRAPIPAVASLGVRAVNKALGVMSRKQKVGL